MQRLVAWKQTIFPKRLLRISSDLLSVTTNQSIKSKNTPSSHSLYVLGGVAFYFITSSNIFAKYFMLFRHSSNVFPVAPTSIIVVAGVKCWLYLEFLSIIGLNNPWI